VRTHVNAVYHKLGVHAKSEAQALFERETAACASAQTAVQSEQA
jgi:DNA-binding NarL/FixJ family response regulator